MKCCYQALKQSLWKRFCKGGMGQSSAMVPPELGKQGLFNKVRHKSYDGNHHLSYLEVYNETVRDLLSPGLEEKISRGSWQQGLLSTEITQQMKCILLWSYSSGAYYWNQPTQ